MKALTMLTISSASGSAGIVNRYFRAKRDDEMHMEELDKSLVYLYGYLIVIGQGIKYGNQYGSDIECVVP